jgi:creatinine amidohydrolase
MKTNKTKPLPNSPHNKGFWFDELSMKEAKEYAKSRRVIILPVGSVEEHGDHLPLCTDSLQPEYIAHETSKRTGCLVAPTLKYGVCNSTRNFPGTISIQVNTLHNITKDILEEFIRNGFTRILILSGHAGQSHMAALRLAAQETIWNHQNTNPEKPPRIMVCSDYDFAYELKGKQFDEKDGHAGTIETSRVMAIKPHLIKSKGKKSFPTTPRFEITANPEHYFPSGVIGDPTAATPQKGRMINKYVITEVTKLIKELEKDEPSHQ